MTFDSLDLKHSNSFRAHMHRNGLLAALRTKLRVYLMKARRWYLVKCWGMDIHPDSWVSLRAKLDRTNPRGIHIGEGTLVAFGAVILSHDFLRRIHDVHTVIGRNCFIGAESFILPGITIGDNVIVGARSVVTQNVPANTMVAGNPARIIRRGIHTGKWGQVEASVTDLREPVAV